MYVKNKYIVFKKQKIGEQSSRKLGGRNICLNFGSINTTCNYLITLLDNHLCLAVYNRNTR